MSYSYSQNIRDIEKYNLQRRKEELREQHALEREMKAKQVGGITDSDMIYYNILIKNNNTGFDSSGNPNAQNGAINVVFNEARSQPYLSCAAEYYMSVVRFSIDTPSLPVFIAEPYQLYTDPNLLIYSVSIVNTRAPPSPTPPVGFKQVTTITTNIVWTPEDLSAPVPPTAPTNYTNYPYYYCYSFAYFINLVNNALASAYRSAVDAVPGSVYIAPPFFKFENDIVTFVASGNDFYTTLDGTCNNNGFLVFMNTSLYNLFSSATTNKWVEPFNDPKNSNNNIFFKYYDPTNPLGCNHQLINYADQSGVNDTRVYQNVDKVPITSGPSYGAFNTPCDNSPFATWNPIESIVFTTSLLPVVSELNAAPTIYSEPYCNPYYSVVVPEIVVDPVTFKTSLVYPSPPEPDNAAVLSVLTDFATDLYYGTEYKPSVSYQPIAEFRLADLYDEKPINQIEISVFWKDKFGILHPFKLCSGGTAQIKIMFRKKEI